MSPMLNDLVRGPRFDKVVEEIQPVGTDLAPELAETRSNLGRWLLVEKNVGSSGDPSHWFTTHGSLDAAGQYHVGQEYAADWEIAFAVDLDKGDRYEGQVATVVWTNMSTLASPLPEPPDNLKDAWARFQRGDHVEPHEARALDEWRADCAQDAGY